MNILHKSVIRGEILLCLDAISSFLSKLKSLRLGHSNMIIQFDELGLPGVKINGFSVIVAPGGENCQQMFFSLLSGHVLIILGILKGP